MSNRLSLKEKQQRQIAFHKPPTNEEIITRLEGELAATKLHLEAEINGRRAACNQLHSANSRIDQLHTENTELRSQLQQTQAQLEAARGPRGPPPGPLKTLINAMPTLVQTEHNYIQCYR